MLFIDNDTQRKVLRIADCIEIPTEWFLQNIRD